MIAIFSGYCANGEPTVAPQPHEPTILTMSNLVVIARTKNHNLPRLLEDGFQTTTQKVETTDCGMTALVRSRERQSVPVRFVTIAPLNAINAETLVGIEILLPDYVAYLRHNNIPVPTILISSPARVLKNQNRPEGHTIDTNGTGSIYWDFREYDRNDLRGYEVMSFTNGVLKDYYFGRRY